MDIFNGNQKLEEAIMYSLDWGIFLRHNMDGPIAPFMYLFNGEDQYTRVLMTDGDPMEYALKILEKEEKPFQQFVIGIEGYLRDDQDARTDAIIVQGFDKTQDKGVALGQMFEPMENNGTFKKIDKVTFLGNPERPLAFEEVSNPDYSVEELSFNAIAVKSNELTQYVAFFTHANPSVIANSMKRFVRSKLLGDTAESLNGRFDLKITPGLVNFDEFLKFLCVTAITEERASPHALEWESKTGRRLQFNISHGDNPYLTEFTKESSEEEPEKEETKKEDSKYKNLTNEELNAEYYRIIAIPNARTNISALTDMSDLIGEYKKRGLDMPGEKSTAIASKSNKPWWKFW